MTDMSNLNVQGQTPAKSVQGPKPKAKPADAPKSEATSTHTGEGSDSDNQVVEVNVNIDDYRDFGETGDYNDRMPDEYRNFLKGEGFDPRYDTEILRHQFYNNVNGEPIHVVDVKKSGWGETSYALFCGKFNVSNFEKPYDVKLDEKTEEIVKWSDTPGGAKILRKEIESLSKDEALNMIKGVANSVNPIKLFYESAKTTKGKATIFNELVKKGIDKDALVDLAKHFFAKHISLMHSTLGIELPAEDVEMAQYVNAGPAKGESVETYLNNIETYFIDKERIHNNEDLNPKIGPDDAMSKLFSKSKLTKADAESFINSLHSSNVPLKDISEFAGVYQRVISEELERYLEQESAAGGNVKLTGNIRSFTGNEVSIKYNEDKSKILINGGDFFNNLSYDLKNGNINAEICGKDEYDDIFISEKVNLYKDGNTDITFIEEKYGVSTTYTYTGNGESGKMTVDVGGQKVEIDYKGGKPTMLHRLGTGSNDSISLK